MKPCDETVETDDEVVDQPSSFEKFKALQNEEIREDEERANVIAEVDRLMML
jgi:hypothetical protein